MLLCRNSTKMVFLWLMVYFLYCLHSIDFLEFGLFNHKRRLLKVVKFKAFIRRILVILMCTYLVWFCISLGFLMHIHIRTIWKMQGFIIFIACFFWIQQIIILWYIKTLCSIICLFLFIYPFIFIFISTFIFLFTFFFSWAVQKYLYSYCQWLSTN